MARTSFGVIKGSRCMSYFLCLATPPDIDEKVPLSFDKRIYRTDVSNFPIGIATKGPKHSWKATLLQIGSSSASLIGKAGVRRTHNNDLTVLLIAGIQVLLQDKSCSSLSFLVHWMEGHIKTENIPIRSEQSFQLPDLTRVVSSLDEDVRYTVLV